ncbi:uncharacterized protein A4U43_C10F290 [Asparagus officinalis]|uniref:Prenylcysteine lyase domain-containing protein n=1 Tax=Asparagus officinalis TaxID=4686 RepID=A0A5P1DZS1_ASPOF|nr:farnesylcysteine lyase [Asparagus officinalis]ONK55718.1 uncharacterized protein A4U43_C10F290 [Asparagus officinalis]
MELNQSPPRLNLTLLFFFLLLSSLQATTDTNICIVGSGIAGSSLAHFIKHFTCTDPQNPNPGSCSWIDDIRIFERRAVPGGRMATVTIAGDTFEAGGSIIHPKNFHALRFASMLNLSHSPESDEESDSWFGIWDGSRFVFKTLQPPPSWSSFVVKKIYSLLNSLLLFRRYGFSLIRMNGFVQGMLDRFLLYYKGFEARPVFETVDEMLKWSGLYDLTRRTLGEELIDAGLSSHLISELVTVVTRINYGQSVSISGLAGAVSLAGSDSGLWSVDGGNWKLAAGLINYSGAKLHLNEEINSISHEGVHYVLNSSKGNSYKCEVTVIATPLDELSIAFTPSISLPNRRLHHTYTTFVRGLLNFEYFGFKHASEIPALIGTLEVPDVPFSSISILKKYDEEDMTYKMFSRGPADDSLLDQLFSVRKETVRIDWPAYPHFKAPEVFAPILLDDRHLYYINSFENAASTIETSAVAAENVARLIISRLEKLASGSPTIKIPASNDEILHLDL